MVVGLKKGYYLVLLDIRQALRQLEQLSKLALKKKLKFLHYLHLAVKIGVDLSKKLIFSWAYLFQH